jgi:hypothetical protein
MRRRGYSHLARGDVDEELGEQEVPDHVDSELLLESLLRGGRRSAHDTRIAKQDDPVVLAPYVAGERLDGLKIGKFYSAAPVDLGSIKSILLERVDCLLNHLSRLPARPKQSFRLLSEAPSPLLVQCR